jgi:hypothetical protein
VFQNLLNRNRDVSIWSKNCESKPKQFDVSQDLFYRKRKRFPCNPKTLNLNQNVLMFSRIFLIESKAFLFNQKKFILEEKLVQLVPKLGQSKTIVNDSNIYERKGKLYDLFCSRAKTIIFIPDFLLPKGNKVLRSRNY